jgi:hypothetical protein
MRRRRYEILLPLTHNDGRPVSPDKFQQTKDELISQFGAVSMSAFAVIGAWVHEGTRYEDESRRFTVDVEDSPENQHFMAEYKKTLLERFEQIEIDMVSFPVEII